MDRNNIDRELSRLAAIEEEASCNEEKRLATTKENLELDKLTEELEGIRQDRKQRGQFALFIFVLMCLYLIAVLVIVILKGAGLLLLDNIVLNALLTTTTANIIGIFIIVAKYLFHH